MSKPALTFLATVEKVQTMTDGAIRVTLDLPETAIEQMAGLADFQRRGLVLDIRATEAAKPVEQTDPEAVFWSSVTNGKPDLS